MKIFIDIGHPAHVHYFRNFIKLMEKKNYEFFISARDRNIIQYLLNHYQIKFFNRGKGGRGIIGKIFYLFKGDYEVLKLAKLFQPDLFLSFGSMYAAQVSKILNKPHIAFDDTDIAIFEHFLYVPFTDLIITPMNFLRNFGRKHIRFNGFMEMAYLHKKYFTEDKELKEKLSNQKYAVLRFSSWDANHDLLIKKTKKEEKIKLIELLKNEMDIIVVSENQSENELSTLKINYKPESFHTILANAFIYIGENGTTATEAAILGTPSVLISPLAKKVGNHLELSNKYKLQYIYDNLNEAIYFIKKLIKNNELKYSHQLRSEQLFMDKIDVTEFMMNIVEEFIKTKFHN
jgi:predicted glycosyltransferase